MSAKALMIQGTGSHVGKSLLAAALCRIFTQDGHRVRPFKAQNMSNNADVTPDGGEIGRAQAEQARACRAEPSVLMNPILLKPTTDCGAQVIVLGRAVGTMSAREYQAFKPTLLGTLRDALRTLRDQADLLILEGAGSPAEINLKSHDLVNMWAAKEAGATVLLVGDIDRGGVFAQLVGTMELLDEDEQALVGGFLINKFRGDPSLLASGLEWLQARYGRPVLGTVPWFSHLAFAEEDTVPSHRFEAAGADGRLRIEVVHLPRISNFTDVDPLAQEPDVYVSFITRPPLNGATPDCLILPGTKSTIADLAALRFQGFESYLHRCVQAGTEVVGLCGGFQMLCREIRDPEGVEASVPSAPGFGLLPAKAVFQSSKTVAQVQGVHLESRLPVSGYEIHMGQMQPLAAARPVFRLTERGGQPVDGGDGLSSADGRIWGTHVHGVFEAAEFRGWWLNRLRRRKGLSERHAEPSPQARDVYDELAALVRPHLDMDRLTRLVWG